MVVVGTRLRSVTSFRTQTKARPAESRPVRPMTRRLFLQQVGAVAALSAGAPFALHGAGAGGGSGVAEPFDRAMEEFMSTRKVPGGALAVVKEKRLVYARGYGWADRAAQEAVRPESLFRIASISKPFTAVAVMKLAEAGRLDLDAPVFGLLGLEPRAEGKGGGDERLKKVTVRHCLQHTGGWDRDASGDPMFRSVKTAREMGVEPPARQDTIIRYMLSKRLDFDPGARYAYSNFGYCLLGRVIEKLSGKAYADYVRETVFQRAGIKGMKLGASLENGRAAAEVRYYTAGDAKGASVFPAVRGKVPVPYGSFCLEAMDSHGGWLASAVDLARFAVALEPGGACLKADSLKTLYEPPAAPVSRDAEGKLAGHFYALGWSVRPAGRAGQATYSHNGSLPGTFTALVRRYDGLSWAVLFNQRSDDSKLPDGAIDGALHRAADSVRDWPAHDLFSAL